MIASLNTHNASRISGSTHNTSQSFNNSSIQESNVSNHHNYVDDQYRKLSETDITESTKKNAFPKLTLAMLLGVVAIAAGWQFGATQGTLNASNKYEKAMFYKDLNELGEKYRINYDSILQIKSGKYRKSFVKGWEVFIGVRPWSGCAHIDYLHHCLYGQ